jgi:hypothetical protein
VKSSPFPYSWESTVLTLAALQGVLYLRRGKFLAKLWPSAVDASSSAAYLADPIAYGLRQTGYSVADPFAPVDADLAAVALTDIDQVADVSELRLLESLVGNWLKPDAQMGQDKQMWGSLLVELRQLLQDKAAACKSQYGQGLMGLTPCSLDLGFAAQDDAITLANLYS